MSMTKARKEAKAMLRKGAKHHEIADRLNSLGHTTPRGAKWNGASVCWHFSPTANGSKKRRAPSVEKASVKKVTPKTNDVLAGVRSILERDRVDADERIALALLFIDLGG